MQSIPTKVTVTNYNTQYSFFDVEIPVGKESSVYFKGCKVINGANGSFVAVKSEKSERNGEVKWWPMGGIKGDKLHAVIIEAVEEAKKALGVLEDAGGQPFDPDNQIPF